MKKIYTSLVMFFTILMIKISNKLVQHCIRLQNIDPKNSLKNRLDNVFTEIHNEAYNKKVDYSWATLKFQENKNNLNLSKEEFMKYTDISNLPNDDNFNFLKVKKAEDLGKL